MSSYSMPTLNDADVKTTTSLAVSTGVYVLFCCVSVCVYGCILVINVK